MTINRRTVLRGIGGTAVALPALEIMFDGKEGRKALAAGAPRRYAVVFGGFAPGCMQVGQTNNGIQQEVGMTPTTTGFDYQIGTAPGVNALQPLVDKGVKNEVSIVSKLRIPWAAENRGVIPVAGRPDGLHSHSASPLLCGWQSDPGDGETSHARCSKPTSDQVIIDALGTPAGKVNSMQFRAEPIYTGGGPSNGRETLSWGLDSTGALQPLLGYSSPSVAYDRFFKDLQPPSPADMAKRTILLRARKSVLDLVRDDTDRLLPQLGAFDRQRLRRHLDEIRALEQSINVNQPVTAPACSPPPAVADSSADENLKRFIELIRIAFVCDLTRSVSLMLSTFQSGLNMRVVGVNDGVHNTNHTGTPVNGAKVVQWHIGHFASLVAALRDTDDISGKLLDSTALVFACEAGIGWDPYFSQGPSSHSSENMVAMVAGRVGGLKPGYHIEAPGMHPAQVVISAMKAVGGPTTLGQVSGTIPGLV